MSKGRPTKKGPEGFRPSVGVGPEGLLGRPVAGLRNVTEGPCIRVPPPMSLTRLSFVHRVSSLLSVQDDIPEPSFGSWGLRSRPLLSSVSFDT